MKKDLLIKVIVFLAAFLLFQIELIATKILLPEFGGGYSVWGASVVFFQATLLLGYLYSHIVISRLGIGRYRYIHLGLIALTLLFFPGRALLISAGPSTVPIVINIFLILTATIGPAFFFLSTTSVIFQSWLASSESGSVQNPYVLYGISNLGSFAALLTYPFVFEPLLGIDAQVNIWRIAYFLLVILHLVALRVIKIAPVYCGGKIYHANKIDLKYRLKWFLFGASGVMIFLAVTNVIIYEIIPMPLLWILPLAIYLLSFMLNFKRRPLCPAWIRENIHITLAISVAIFFLAKGNIVDFAIMFIVYLAVLSVLCMFCQSELYRTRPSDDRRMTVFYLMTALGGFVGGIIVSWILPLVFTSAVDFLLGLLVITLAISIDKEKPVYKIQDLRIAAETGIILILWPLVFYEYNLLAVTILCGSLIAAYSALKGKPVIMAVSIMLGICIAVNPFTSRWWSMKNLVYEHRNYYGIYQVYDGEDKRFFSHGTTMHGAQYLDPKRSSQALAYYHPMTPAGKLLNSSLFEFKHIGMAGVGVGVISAYGKPGQTIDLFELDPDVVMIAEDHFTYLKNCKAEKKFVIGDARISIKNSPEKYYDLLIIDAFSGDSLPTHLLTMDAISEYRRHMTKDGLILFHITNNYLKLSPVIMSEAVASGAYGCVGTNTSMPGAGGTEWAAVTWSKDIYDKLISRFGWTPASEGSVNKVRPWTDQYTNISGVLDVKGFIDRIKEFRPLSLGTGSSVIRDDRSRMTVE